MPCTVAEGAQLDWPSRRSRLGRKAFRGPLLFALRRDRLSALFADANFLIAFKLVADAGRSAVAADQQHIRDVDRRFLLGDATLDVALRIGADILLHHPDMRGQSAVLFSKHTQHAALFAFVAAGNYLHLIVA